MDDADVGDISVSAAYVVVVAVSVSAAVTEGGMMPQMLLLYRFWCCIRRCYLCC